MGTNRDGDHVVTRWGHGGDHVRPGGDPVGTRWGQVAWGPPGGDQVETSRGGDQVGTRWGHGGDQVGPGGDPVGTTWGPPGAGQVETSRGGDQVGTSDPTATPRLQLDLRPNQIRSWGGG